MLTPSDQKSSLFREKSEASKQIARLCEEKDFLTVSLKTIYISDFAGDRV